MAPSSFRDHGCFQLSCALVTYFVQYLVSGDKILLPVSRGPTRCPVMLSEAAQLLLGGAAAKTLLAWGPTPWSDAGASPSTQLSPAAGPVGRNLGARPGTGGCSQLLPAAAPFGGAFPRPRLLTALSGASSAGAGGKARAGKARGRSPWHFPSLRADIFTSLASGVHKPPGQDAPHAKPRSAAARPRVTAPLPSSPRTQQQPQQHLGSEPNRRRRVGLQAHTAVFYYFQTSKPFSSFWVNTLFGKPAPRGQVCSSRLSLA